MARRVRSTHRSTKKNMNPMKLLNKTMKGLKKMVKVGKSISRKTVRTTRSLLKSADKMLAKLDN